jgi:alpha,alpha-trehalase
MNCPFFISYFINRATSGFMNKINTKLQLIKPQASRWCLSVIKFCTKAFLSFCIIVSLSFSTIAVEQKKTATLPHTNYAKPLVLGQNELFPSQVQIDRVRAYIKKSWSTLSRSNRNILTSAPDPKVKHIPGNPWPVYISVKENRSQIEQTFQQILGSKALSQIEIRTLSKKPEQISEHGLLYLPYPYVVPGGRFNEMYGWDSYFIQVGLLRDGKFELAKNMVDNFIYQIEHYGAILNANRTYYLTRSQPPFLTRMILGVFEQTKDKKWLESTLPAIENYNKYWTTSPKLIEEIGLSRYFDLGEGPAPEVISSERDKAGKTHYDRVQEYYRTHKIDAYDVSQYYDQKRDQLTPLFYKGDRSMRESGFDPSNRFGPFNIDIIHYTPVCLNVLLYQMEIDTAQIKEILGDQDQAQQWKQRAQKRKQLINQFLWDEKAGLYLDYNFQTNQRRHYEFATTFYPLWAGIATEKQARRVVENLPKFEAAGGLLTSTQVTGNQWDKPFGWAPLQLIAVNGLRRYGYHQQADRLAQKFISLVTKEFEEHGTLVEKYDVVRRESDVTAGIRFGYSSNEVGFGWTNAVFIELLHKLISTLSTQ